MKQAQKTVAVVTTVTKPCHLTVPLQRIETRLAWTKYRTEGMAVPNTILIGMKPMMMELTG